MKYPYWAHYVLPVGSGENDHIILIFLCVVLFCLVWLSRG